MISSSITRYDFCLQADALPAAHAQPLYHKGSGLASLAKFLANAQHLHGAAIPQQPFQKGAIGVVPPPNLAQQVAPNAAADGSKSGSAQKYVAPHAHSYSF